MAAKSINLAKLTPSELKNLLVNNERHGQAAMVHAVLQEMTKRGIATRREYRALSWNQDRVGKVMKPFQQVASHVPHNQRTAYTEAGGYKIGRSKDDPDRMWIDTYSAIKTSGVNAVFVCYIKRPGEDPEFELQLDGVRTQSYNADGLVDALKEWQAVAARAEAV
jgi:hypothetical protein